VGHFSVVIRIDIETFSMIRKQMEI
jgi:hypothetical protein